MKKTFSLFLLAFFVMTLVSFSAAPRASAAVAAFRNIWEGASCAPQASTQGPTGSCSVCDGLVVTSNIIYDMFIAATIITALMIVAGGIVLMTAGASEKNFSLGKSIMLSAVTGLVIALAAWLVMNTFLSFLTGKPSLPWASISCQETNIKPPSIAPSSTSTPPVNPNSNDPATQLKQLIAAGCASQTPICAQKSQNNSSGDQSTPPNLTFETVYQIACQKNSQNTYDFSSRFDCITPVISPWLKCSDPAPDIATICGQ